MKKKNVNPSQYLPTASWQMWFYAQAFMPNKEEMSATSPIGSNSAGGMNGATWEMARAIRR